MIADVAVRIASHDDASEIAAMSRDYIEQGLPWTWTEARVAQRSHQRKGVGSAILQWLEKVARTAGARRIRVECRANNAAARNFYGEHGYHECIVTRRMYRGISDGINLEKHLRASSARK